MKIKYSTMITENMEETVKFYNETLGFEIESTFDLPNNAKITLLKCEGETLIEVIQNNIDKVGLYSIGIEVTDLNKTVANLKEKGVKFLLEPTEISVGSMARFQDPNGVNIVLLQHY